MKPIIVIPTYNEKDNINKLIPKIFSLAIPSLEIIVVDDNSPDNTATAVRKLGRNFPISLIVRPKKLGLGSAYIEGFAKALENGADCIIQMDADFSHDPSDVPRLLADGKRTNLVIGSRKITGGNIVGWGIIRKFMSNGAMGFARSMLGLKTHDVTAGFRCYQRIVLETIRLYDITSNGYAFQEEMLYRTQRLGFSILEIPVTFTDRQRGKSKLTKKDIVEFFLVIWKLRKLKIVTTNK